MSGSIFIFIGAIFVMIWGVAHLFPTKNIVRGFGEISDDNKQIILMEWIIEGAALIFIGLLVAAATIIDRYSPIAHFVYWISFGFLNVLSLISLFTGFKISLLPFKLCPLIFTGSSLFIVAGIITL